MRKLLNMKMKIITRRKNIILKMKMKIIEFDYLIINK